MDTDRTEPHRSPMVKASPTTFCVYMSRADAAFVRRQVKTLDLKGASHFFQRLLSEARGARLPVVTEVKS